MIGFLLWVKAAAAAIPLRVWLAIGAVLAIALAVLWYGSNKYQEGAASRELEIANLTTMLETERAANESNMTTIAKLVAENKAWADAAEARNAQAAEAVAAVTRERDALAAELAQRRNNRGTIYHEDQDAAAWARQPLPRRIADQLRE